MKFAYIFNLQMLQISGSLLSLISVIGTVVFFTINASWLSIILKRTEINKKIYASYLLIDCNSPRTQGGYLVAGRKII